MSATTRKSSVADTPVNQNDISSSSKSNGTPLDRRDSESDEGSLYSLFINVLYGFWSLITIIQFWPDLNNFSDKRVLKVSEKDRKIGHRRINEEGEVSYKKIHSNQLVASIQLGIQVTWWDNILFKHIDSCIKKRV